MLKQMSVTIYHAREIVRVTLRGRQTEIPEEPCKEESKMHAK
jgi:hypothetical protein